MTKGPIPLKAIPLWQERWSEAALRAKAREDKRAFQRGFRMEAFSDDERTFPSWGKCIQETHAALALGKGWACALGVDLSSPTRPGTAIVGIAKSPQDGRKHLVYARCGAWRSNETALEISKAYRLCQPLAIGVETNAYQTALVDWSEAVNAPWWHMVEALMTGSNKHSPTIGLPGLQVQFDLGAWVVPRLERDGHESDCGCGWCRLDREVADYPMSKTSDVLMAAWFASLVLDRYSGMAAGPLDVSGLSAR